MGWTDTDTNTNTCGRQYQFLETAGWHTPGLKTFGTDTIM